MYHKHYCNHGNYHRSPVNFIQQPYAPHESQLSSQTHGSWLQAGHSLVAIAVTTLLFVLLVHSLLLLFQEFKQILVLFLYGTVLLDNLLVF